jgi:hypothetical protein
MGCILIGPVGIGLLLGILNTATRSIANSLWKATAFERPSLFNNPHEETFRYRMAMFSNSFTTPAPSCSSRLNLGWD